MHRVWYQRLRGRQESNREVIMEKHDIEIQEIECDEQTTVWIMRCTKCGKKSRPLYSKYDVQGATDELSCPGKKTAEVVA